MRQTQTVILTTLFIITIIAATGDASAIIGNFQQDTKHTNVGLVVFYTLDQGGNRIPVQVCSGILLSPRVLLTAAHACLSDFVTVCFDSGPITWSVQGGQIQLQGVTRTYDGTAYPHPDFAMNTQSKKGSPAFMTHDIAIVILEEPVPETKVSEYGQLPYPNLVDTLSSNTPVTLVGYGMNELTKKAEQQNMWMGPIMRCSAQAKIIPSNFAWGDEFIRCSASPGNGRGGIAYGDSGGPVFLGESNVVLALHSYVNNQNCAGVTYHSRLDLPDIISWISQEVNVHG